MFNTLPASDLTKAAEIIHNADALIICAGAGIGVDSGLLDFRSHQGFWKAYPALAKAQLTFAEVASQHTFKTDPTLAWGFYGHRLNLYRNTQRHRGFYILKNWARENPLGAWIFTSNVDGQFQIAGFSTTQIHEIHGSIHLLQCLENCSGDVWPAEGFRPEIDNESCRITNELPKCPYCNQLARPNILMFADGFWNNRSSALQKYAKNEWLRKVDDASASIAFVEIGAGTAILSVRHFSHQQVRERGAKLVRIKPREFVVPDDRSVRLPVGS